MITWASPPLCDQGHGFMVPDHGLDEEGANDGRLLYVCPTCCWNLPRAAPMGGEPPCKCPFCRASAPEGRSDH